jgi:hypothetical protein
MRMNCLLEGIYGLSVCKKAVDELEEPDLTDETPGLMFGLHDGWPFGPPAEPGDAPAFAYYISSRQNEIYSIAIP